VYRQNAPAKWCASFRLLLTPWVVARVWGRSELQEEGGGGANCRKRVA